MSARLRWRAARPDDRWIAGLWGATALAALAVHAWAPWLVGGGPGCVFHLLTGVPCPSCGATRAMLRLLAGDPAGALAWNPLATLAGAALLAGGLAAPLWVGLVRRVPDLPSAWPLAWRLALPALVLLNWGYLIAHGV